MNWTRALLFAPLFWAGCIGAFSNKALFLNDPAVGTELIDVIKEYGTPAFTAEEGSQRILVYEVRDVKYIVLVGLYQGYDLVVVLENGKVKETKKVQRPNTMTFLQPVPWAVTD